MDSALFHHASSVGDALSGVMIAAYDKNLQPSSDKRDQEIIEQIDRLHRRNGLVINIPGNDHRIGMVSVDQFNDLFQYVFLVIQHGVSVHTLPQM